MTTATQPLSKNQQRYQKEKERRKVQGRERYAANRERLCAEVRARRLADPERHKSLRLKSTYGITLAERDAMFAAQGSVCKICGTGEPNSAKGWHTDHCHTGGNVRGILCHHCNSMLGYARDNPATLAAAITYLSH